jgi:hypothetical protein
MQPGIPKDQIDRLEPIVETLLNQLRHLTSRLPCETASALDYAIEPEQLNPGQTQSEASQ